MEYLNAFVQKNEGSAVLIFRFDEIDNAIDALLKAGVRILSDDQIQRV